MPQIFLYKKNSPTQATGIHGKLFFTMLGLLASTAPSGGGLAGWKFQKDLFLKKKSFIFIYFARTMLSFLASGAVMVLGRVGATKAQITQK